MSLDNFFHYQDVAVTYYRFTAQALGLNQETVGPLLRGTSLTPEYLYGECEFISLADNYQIQENIIKLYPKQHIGLVLGSQADISTHGLMGVAVQSAETLLAGLKSLVDYYVIRAPYVVLRFVEEEDSISILAKCHHPVPEGVRCFINESTLTMLQSVCEKMLGYQLCSASVFFAHPSPEDTEKHEKYLHSPVTFGVGEYSYYKIPRVIAETPLVTADPKLHSLAVSSCEEVISKTESNNRLSGMVANIIKEAEEHYPSLEQAADQLCMSSRQLMRKLQQEQTSYRHILNEHQRELAKHLLKKLNMSLGDIAHHLGYTEVSNFRRAFKRWEGMSPSDYRTNWIGSDQA